MIVYLTQDNYGFSGMKYSGIVLHQPSKEYIPLKFFKFDIPIQNKEEAYQKAIIMFSTNKWVLTDSK